MIVTFTANPSLDRTIELGSALDRGGVQRAFATQEQPGGKGVNVSRALMASGLETIAVLPGTSADPMLVALRAEKIPHASLAIAGRIRSNITLTEPDGTTTKINEPGPALDESDEIALIDLVVSRARDAAWLVLAGSLPPGLPVDFYARVVTAVRNAGPGAEGTTPRIAVDSSGAPMAALIASGVGVDLIKPNAEELAEITGIGDGHTLESDPLAAYSAAQSLVERGCAAVLATLGAKGAVLVTAEGGWMATMPPIVPVSTVGAGDSSLAGYLVSDEAGGTPHQRLAQAVAHGSAAASLPGSTMPATAQTRPETATVTVLTPISADR
ncbi:1-phosphofructokinase [Glaciihabitans tibetensis]|uniref:1-phosphofructokinase n=1 Tax=Glaciihabitans tibetensis TaxID=1266600 RepID=A0A2T0VK08_9MICO|nr:1-phosphofructokinase family hexose kinase [Glaciihabitans tibetensis]PRY70534.1 1-phosphofructokinase [Glaciihabitans tibetensis]